MPSTDSATTEARLQELLDRAALRNLVESYAAFADTGNPDGVAGLFAPDATLVVALKPGAEPTAIRRGREEIGAAMAALSRYQSTTHVIANALFEIDGDKAGGRIGCVAHHMEGTEEAPRDRVLYIRYTDVYAKTAGSWFFTNREVRVITVENRPTQID